MSLENIIKKTKNIVVAGAVALTMGGCLQTMAVAGATITGYMIYDVNFNPDKKEKKNKKISQIKKQKTKNIAKIKKQKLRKKLKYKPEFTYDKFYPTVELRYGAKITDKWSKEYSTMIERVPDQIQKIIQDKGLKITYFNGSLTNNKEMADEKGKIVEFYKKKGKGGFEYMYDYWSGIYISADKRIFLGVEGFFASGRRKETALHEYGHAYDYILGPFFYGKKKFSDLEHVKKIMKTEKFNSSYHDEQPKEFVAESISRYYQSDESRLKFIKSHPRMAQYLSNVEDAVIRHYKTKAKEEKESVRKKSYQNNPSNLESKVTEKKTEKQTIYHKGDKGYNYSRVSGRKVTIFGDIPNCESYHILTSIHEDQTKTIEYKCN